MSHEAASSTPHLLSLPPELQLQILGCLEGDAASILNARLVNHQISAVAQDVFAKTFLSVFILDPGRDLPRLLFIADHEQFRHHVRVLKIQPRPRRHGEEILPVRPREEEEFLHCLSRLPNCVSFTIRDINEEGAVAIVIPWRTLPTDCLPLLIRAAVDPVHPTHIRSLRIVLSGQAVGGTWPYDGCVWPYQLPSKLIRSSTFKNNVAANLRTLHLAPFLTLPRTSFDVGNEDFYFEVFMLIISAAENLESLVIGSFDARAGRLVRELANLPSFPPRLRHFALKGGSYDDADQQRVATGDLIKVLKRAGAGGTLRYLYLSYIYLDEGLAGWRSVLETIRDDCALTNLSIESCGCHHAGSWDSLYFCPLYRSLRHRLGGAAVTDPCVFRHARHQFEGEMHSVAITDEHSGIFEFVSTPWASITPGIGGVMVQNTRLHDMGVRYSYQRDAGPHLDAEGNTVNQMAEAIDAIRDHIYLDSRNTLDEDQCQGRLPNQGRNSGPRKLCGVGFLPDKDDDSWLDVRRACTATGLRMDRRGDVRGTSVVQLTNTFYMP